MTLMIQLLWAAMMLTFLAGGVMYAFRPQVGIALLKKALVLLLMLLIGPSLVSSAMAQVPLSTVVLLLAGGSVAAYVYLSRHHQAKGQGHRHASGVSNAERQPQLPHEGDQE